MPKTAPSLGRILTMVVFALSCFGLLLFLWLSFGGPTPLQPEGYRFKAAFPEAATLAEEADVRIAGVNVGKVKTKELDKGGARTIAEIEMDEQFAPIPADTRAILRQKTLLGETYVELTPGTATAPKLAEGAELTRTNVEPTVELDELLRIFRPETQEDLRNWVQYSAQAIEGGTSQDLNDALGNLPEFATDGSDVLQVLDEQEQAVRELVRNTGVVFGALNEQEGALRELIVNSENTFDATAQEKEALAETIQIFPTFLRESRLTLDRLERFSLNTRPLVNDLKPVADDLGPTVRDLGDLSPDLRQLFNDLIPLIAASEDGFPAAERFLRGARPVLRGLHTFLPEFNPILSFFNYTREQITGFITNGAGVIVPRSNPHISHGQLPQFGVINSRSLALSKERPEYERGNAYHNPNYLKRALAQGAFETFDCKNRPGNAELADPVDPPSASNPPTPGGPPVQPPCLIAPDTLWDGGRYPQVDGKQGVFQGRLIKRPAPIQRDGRSCRGPGAIGGTEGNAFNQIPLCSTSRSR
jgi:virulence factor Mce-like protein